ncbi:MAG: DUF4199 domain-containing protein [Candidatus Kapabacteria bacterium]|nr:DUF4199 domain-containing protein [Ignavibacteriota bacterium]MCW5884066.1 DUF4199 domain-containing protein [Candidatus Kapabacteria bacterium]MCW5919431.1 DUF4199 domain-containing protein [Bacteroidota bacterium]
MKNFKIEAKWAFIFIGSQLLWMLLEKLVGLHDKHIDKHQYLTMLYSIVAIAIYVFALLDKRKNYHSGAMTYKQGFVAGLIITVIVTIFSPLTQWIISSVITPDYFKNVIQYSVETGYHKSIADAEAQFNLKSYMIQSTIGALIMGIVTTAIVAIFTRRKNRN